MVVVDYLSSMYCVCTQHKHLKVNEPVTFHAALHKKCIVAIAHRFLYPQKKAVIMVRTSFIMQLSDEYCIQLHVKQLLSTFAHS